MSVRHLYVHLPFCASRCGYCAFVVETRRLGRRDAYLDALVAELDAGGGPPRRRSRPSTWAAARPR